MSKIGEAQVTRLARERLAAIKKFIPVRDKFRDNLQAQQQQRDDFRVGAVETFKPITESTEKIVAATEQVGKETEKIARRTKQVKKSLKTLPTDIAAAQLAIQPEERAEERTEERIEGRPIIDPTTIFSKNLIKIIKPVDDIILAKYAAVTFFSQMNI